MCASPRGKRHLCPLAPPWRRQRDAKEHRRYVPSPTASSFLAPNSRQGRRGPGWPRPARRSRLRDGAGRYAVGVARRVIDALSHWRACLGRCSPHRVRKQPGAGDRRLRAGGLQRPVPQHQRQLRAHRRRVPRPGPDGHRGRKRGRCIHGPERVRPGLHVPRCAARHRRLHGRRRRDQGHVLRAAGERLHLGGGAVRVAQGLVPDRRCL